MNITEQKKPDLGATRTFSVSPHTAEAMKHQINAANESGLSRRNQAQQVRTVPPMQDPSKRTVPVQQTAPNSQAPVNRAANPAASSGSVNRTVSQQPVNQQPVNQQPTSRPIRRAEVPAAPYPQQTHPQSNPPAGTSAVNHVGSQAAVSRNPAALPRTSSVRNSTAPTKNNVRKTTEKEHHSSGEGGNTVVSVVKAIVYIIFILICSVALALTAIFIGNDVFAFVKSDELIEVTIPEYATLDEVSDILAKNDIIKYPRVFKLYAVAKKSDNDFLAGTYTVTPMMNYDYLLAEFKEKPETGTVDITIPEGYTVDEIIDLFVEKYNIGTREGFVDVIQNGEFDYWFIKELNENGMSEDRIYRLEGYLFPDTYQFYKATSEWTVVNKMLKRFSQIFTKEYREQCKTLGYTVDEIVTLASLIEKEAGSPSEFFRVSSVFHNRLKSREYFPRFDSDATVVYQLSHEMGERVVITAEDLLNPMPYNTYQHDGFPPGPIANPSASAMLAALQPMETTYYYFIANHGVTYFSETKEEHDILIAEFQQATVQQTTGDIPDAVLPEE